MATVLEFMNFLEEHFSDEVARIRSNDLYGYLAKKENFEKIGISESDSVRFEVSQSMTYDGGSIELDVLINDTSTVFMYVENDLAVSLIEKWMNR